MCEDELQLLTNAVESTMSLTVEAVCSALALQLDCVDCA